MSAHDVINPATEEVVQRVALADADQADAAIARAAVAQESWRNFAPADRARLLRRFSETVDGDLENLAQLEVAYSG
ncbi:MAG: aldehyde dehydrogenase family protein, partial [Trebonia sp.]